jgi:hypothetical protein
MNLVSTYLRGALLATALVALGAGAALAADKQVKDVPQAGPWSAVIEVVPGVHGAAAKAGKPGSGPEIPDDDIDFKVTFDEDGQCRVDGMVAFSWVPGAVYRVEMAGHEVGGVWLVDLHLHEGGTVLYQQLGKALGRPVESIEVDAELIAAFTVAG